MIEYGHGDDTHKFNGIDFKANFSSNVYNLGAHAELKEYLKKQLDLIESYPAPSSENFIQLLSKHHNISNQNCLVTNGATEAFYLITNAFYGSSATICTPSFSEYEQAGKANNLQLEFIDRKSMHQHKFTTKLAFICNPNNPDGFENTSEEIAAIAKSYPDTYFIIDEAYTEFTSSAISCIDLLSEHQNIILVKSLTKLFCVPGLRLGYILSSSPIINKLLQYKMPWNVNSLALQAGEFIFKNYNKILPDFKSYFSDAIALQNEINCLNGFEVVPTNTSYFLVCLPQPKASELKSYLVNSHQLLIRNASNFRTLDEHYIRIASQTPEKNALLIKALRSWNN
ncbi:histidinol-phosphate transaminase [uncultured Tenacibaculum sp.]|uniref:pyridoxal phosphate-dependent aminotransferase n=1 Tax=uncultured Tenacibaculum sp. TaxID=174713 RepID=UPI00262441D3|nr:histidinol-phosphate transaminase [uncultured Tenacibaculum sp.]